MNRGRHGGITIGLVLAIGLSLGAGCAGLSADGGSAKEPDPAAVPVHLFRRFLSGADSDRCPMHPSCSQYGLNAIKKHGPLMGWIMATDRLMRCGRDTIHRVPPVWIHGEQYFYDPVENNDFWWVGPGMNEE